MVTTVKRAITLPENLNKKLDSLKAQGYTASGFIRSLLEKEFSQTKPKRDG